MQEYLDPTYYLNYDHSEVVKYASENIRTNQTSKEIAIQLYYRIRDDFKYSPWGLKLIPESYRASFLLTKDQGNCIEKAVLFTACCRYHGIPSRLAFANVRNHIGTEKLEEMLKTDILVFHGYVEVFLDEKWVKCTPAFNKELCEKLGVSPLEFDGEHDSIFQEYDVQGEKFMEYTHDYGHFSDLPFEDFVAALKKHYPHLFQGDLSLWVSN